MMSANNTDSLDLGEETDQLTTVTAVIKKLEEVWINEKLAPELLLYEGELVDCMLDQIEHMSNSLERIKKDDFRLVIHKMELGRIRYLLCSYLRVRMQKIEKFGAYLLHEESEGRGQLEQMSQEERKFAKENTSSIKEYLQNVALQHMPLNMQSLKLEETGSKPQMGTSVFIKVKKDCPGVIVEEANDNGEEEIVDFRSGSQHILCYQSIAHLLKDGSVSLI